MYRNDPRYALGVGGCVIPVYVTALPRLIRLAIVVGPVSVTDLPQLICLAIVVVTRVGENDLRLDMLFTMFGVFGLLVSGCSLLLLWVKGHPAPGDCLHTTVCCCFLFVCLFVYSERYGFLHSGMFVCCCCLLVGWLVGLLAVYFVFCCCFLTHNGTVY